MFPVKTVLLLCLCLFYSACQQGRLTQQAQVSDEHELSFLEKLYFQYDTLIRSGDTLKILHSKFDTTLIETGIFTYLHVDYPLVVSAHLIQSVKTGIAQEAEGKPELASLSYQKAIACYLHDIHQVYSDMNELLKYQVNASILCSYAYERIGNKLQAIQTLQPYLANAETVDSRIHERYIQLCIAHYGMDSVKNELAHAPQTIYLKDDDIPETDDWLIKVFGADIGMGNAWQTDSFTVSMAESEIKKFAFMRLLK